MRPAPARPTAPRAAPRRGLLGGLLLLLPPVGELARAWPSWLWALLSVVLLRLLHAPFSLWPLAFVALAPWLWGLRKLSPRAAFWLSWAFGAAHFVTVYAWLGELSRFNPFIWLGIPLLGAYLGLYLAAQGALMVWAARRVGPWMALAFSVLLFGALEWFRSVGKLGVPFALLSTGVRDATALAQVASLAGIYLLSALLFWVNLSVMEAAAMLRLRLLDPGAVVRLALPVGLVVGGFAYGGAALARIDADEQAGIPVRLALLQPNVPQELKFAAYASPDPDEQREASMQMTLDLLAMLDALETNAHDLIVAPESAFPEIDFDENTTLHEELKQRALDLGAPILLGAADLLYYTEEGELVDDPAQARLVHVAADGSKVDEGDPAAIALYRDYTVANGAFLFPPDRDAIRSPAADYRKIHLMPFGETVPYFGIIPGLSEKIVQVGEFARGEKDQPALFIHVDTDPEDPTEPRVPVRFAPTICFEDMAPWLHRRLSRSGVQLLVNITNNAWFDDGLGSETHFQNARLRGPETRLPMVLATNTGVTGVVDGAGRVVERLPAREKGVLSVVVRVPEDPSPTLYARLGDWFGWLASVLSIVLGIAIWRMREEDEEA